MPSRPPIPLSPALNVEQCNEDVPGSSLSGKSVLITGGASGVGAAIAQHYAENGAYVTIADINTALGTKHASSLRARGLHAQFTPTDVTSWPSLHTTFLSAHAFPPSPHLSTVIACAGLLGPLFTLPTDTTTSPFTSLPPPPSPSALSVNATGLLYTAKLAQLFFDHQGAEANAEASSLILFSSLLAYLYFPNTAAYTASKHAVRGLFRILRPVFADRGHRVNAVAPWLTRTPMTTAGEGGLVGLFEGVGVRVGEAEGVVGAVVRCDAGPGDVNGRVLAAGPDRVWDMRDDREGRDGQAGLDYLYKEVVPGWDGYVEKMRKVMERAERER